MPLDLSLRELPNGPAAVERFAEGAALFWLRDAAVAARERLKLDRRGEWGARRKMEENSLKVWGKSGKGEEGLKE